LFVDREWDVFTLDIKCPKERGEQLARCDVTDGVVATKVGK